MQGGTVTTEDASEDAPEVVGVEVLDVSPSRDAEVDNTAPPMEILHTMVQIARTRAQTTTKPPHLQIWWVDPRQIAIDMVGTNID